MKFKVVFLNNKVEKGLFEIRAKGVVGIGRLFFCTTKEIVILHSFIKKTQKIPLKEIKTARKRLKEYKNE